MRGSETRKPEARATKPGVLTRTNDAPRLLILVLSPRNEEDDDDQDYEADSVCSLVECLDQGLGEITINVPSR